MSVKDRIKYLPDENGEKNAVVVPLNKWKLMSENIEKFEEYIALKKSLKQGLNEVEQITTGEIDGKTLTSFLHEL